MSVDEYKAVDAKLCDPALTVGTEISTKNFIMLGNTDNFIPIGIDKLGRIWKQDRDKIVCVAETDPERIRRANERRHYAE